MIHGVLRVTCQEATSGTTTLCCKLAPPTPTFCPIASFDGQRAQELEPSYPLLQQPPGGAHDFDAATLFNDDANRAISVGFA